MRFSKLLMLLLAPALISGCSKFHINQVEMFHLSEVNNAHSLIQTDPDLLHAKVYFIRPKTEHPAGFADNLLDVEVEDEDLIQLAKGEYTLVNLKPRDITITLRNLTQIRGRWELTELSQSRQFSLKAGETYYIQTKMIDGEFRGVTFIPEPLGLFEAKKVARYLTAVGLAKSQPIPE